MSRISIEVLLPSNKLTKNLIPFLMKSLKELLEKIRISIKSNASRCQLEISVDVENQHLILIQIYIFVKYVL